MFEFEVGSEGVYLNLMYYGLVVLYVMIMYILFIKREYWRFFLFVGFNNYMIVVWLLLIKI